jgi:uncharacterized membrane protein YdcZ (DUF606 family)
MSKQLAQIVSVINATVLAGILIPVLFAVFRIGVVPDSRVPLLMLLSFTAGALLMLLILVACIRDESLSEASRLRWEFVLIVGGPITSFVYFVRRARKGPNPSMHPSGQKRPAAD